MQFYRIFVHDIQIRYSPFGFTNTISPVTVPMAMSFPIETGVADVPTPS